MATQYGLVLEERAMEMRVFGRGTGIQLSVLGFGCGAVGGLERRFSRPIAIGIRQKDWLQVRLDKLFNNHPGRGGPLDQERTIPSAIAAGVNYFDTGVQYEKGESEKNLGRILHQLNGLQRACRY
jgi:aryl-alcohol dehydrogenase-like predicted oxidoreductase